MSLDDADIAALGEALGDAALSRAEPDGADAGAFDPDARHTRSGAGSSGPRWRLRPEGGEAMAEALRVLSERGLAALVRGGGTRSALGNPVQRADLVLSTEGLGELRELDLEEGVAQLGAGTRIAEVLAALADPCAGPTSVGTAPAGTPSSGTASSGTASSGTASSGTASSGTGWELPLEAAGEASTLGGALASGAPALRFGAPRDAVLGLGVVLASGARTRCGGRVVKNVTGYDLAKLQVGALGSLGVIESAWLRLRPRPERVCAWHLPGDDAGLALELARRPATRAALQVAGEGLWLELAGDAQAVEYDVARLDECPGLRPASTLEVDAAWAPVHGEAAADELRFRIDFRPTRLAGVAEAMAGAGAGWRALPARGLGWARFELAPDAGPSVSASALEAAVSTVARAAAAAGGGWRLEAAPLGAKRGREVFGALGAAGPIMRALKQQFDPGGVLNPGRIAGAP